jgi:hypothetical protein
VNRRFRLAEALEHRLRAIAAGGRQARVIDQVKDFRKTSVRVGVLGGSRNVLGGIVKVLGGSRNVLGVITNVLGGSRNVLGGIVKVLGGSGHVLVHAEFGRRHTGPQHAIGVDVRVAQRQAAEGPPQVVERQAGVEQRAERHVAGDAREAIEIQDSRH